jgi:membrane protein
VTPENNPQRPTQHLEYEPIKKMETGLKRPGTASKALGTVTGMAKEFSSFP